MTPRALDERSPELRAALESGSDPNQVVLGMPDVVDGTSEFTIVTDKPTGEPQAWDVHFEWDGQSQFASFWFDVSEHESLSPGSSSRIHGWVSWHGDTSIALAFAHQELGVHGVAWGDQVPMMDPTTLEATPAPQAWAILGRSVVERVMAALMGETDRARVVGLERD